MLSRLMNAALGLAIQNLAGEIIQHPEITVAMAGLPGVLSEKNIPDYLRNTTKIA